MRKYLLALVALISFTAAKAQLVINEFSQGTGGTKEFFEFVVVGQRTCSDSTADLRGWIFDDNNGWYGSSGAAPGCKRFANNNNWSKVPYGSIILVYNNADKNTNISLADDPTDANHDYVYIIPVNSSYIESNGAQPPSGGSSSWVYVTSGFGSSGGWSELGLNNSAGDGVIVVKPNNLTTAYHSIAYGFSSAGAQTPTISVSQVGAGKNCYLQSSSYTSSSAYTIGNAGTSNETPGAANTVANAAWINGMRAGGGSGFSVAVTKNDVSCFGGNNGSATTNVTGGSTPYTYSWNTSPVQTASGISGLVAGSYAVTVTDNSGCAVVTPITITQPAQLVATASKTDVSCNGSNNGTANVTVTGGTTPYNYSWNTSPVQTTAGLTGLAPGTYTVTITDSKNCTTTSSATVTQPSSLTTTTSKTDVDCYSNANGTATVIASGGTPPYNYSWNTSPVQTTATASGLAAGTYVVTVVDANNCTSTASLTINQPAQLVATASKTDISCNGSNNGAASVTVTGGTTPYNYSWNTSPVQTTATINNLGSGSYTVTVIDAKNCLATGTVTITQPSPLTAYISNKTNIACFGDNNGTATVAAAGGNSPYTYSWNTTPIQTATTATNLAAGTYIVTVNDATNCTATATAAITQPAQKLNATVTTVDVNCHGQNGGSATGIVNGGTSPYTYSWNTVPAQSSPAAVNVPAGNYNLVVADNNGCKDTVDFEIVEPADILIAAHQDKQTCPGLNDGAASVTVSGGTPVYNISWNTTPVQTSLSAVNLSPGNYTVTVTDSKGCVKTSNVIITPFAMIPVSVNADKTNVCSGERINIHATGMKTYTWSPIDGLSCSTCSDVTATILKTTTYTIIGTDTNSCHDTTTLSINAVQHVPVSIDPDIDVCNGTPAQLKAIGGQSYSWSPEITLNSSKIADPVATPDSTTRYSVEITENECFKDTLFQTVRVHQRPVVNAGPDVRGVPGVELQLTATTQNTSKIEWVPADYLSCNTCFNPIIHVQKTITYDVVATNEAGCADTDKITVTASCEGTELYMPNAFTPNGDGQNDYFYPQGKSVGFVKAFKVMNSWGQVVYEGVNVQANSPAGGWDGTFKGETLPPDVFVYMVELGCADGSSNVITGDVTLIR